MTPTERDLAEHQEALKRFGGVMPTGVCKGSDNVATRELSEICMVVQNSKIGRRAKESYKQRSAHHGHD